MKKLLLGTKQAETLLECINLALMCCEGLEEYEADCKRYYELRDRIETQFNNQTETPERVSERRALADEVRDQIRGNKWQERAIHKQLQI